MGKLKIIIALALFAAGCSPKGGQAPTKSDAGSLAAAPTASGSLPAPKPAPPPDCAKVEAKDDGDNGWRHPDCLMREDRSGLNFFAHYGPPEATKDGGVETPIYVSMSPEDAPIIQTM